VLDYLADNSTPNPAALDGRINGEHPELELIFHCDLAVRLAGERKRHGRDHCAGGFGHPHLGMLGPVFHVVQHPQIRVVGGEMPCVEIRFPGDSSDL
jgi:hypothetical protein